MTKIPDDVSRYLDGKNADTVPVFLAFRAAALAAGDDVIEKVSASMVAWKGKRTFATAYIKGKYLECSIDLLERMEHRHLKAAFHTTKTVLTHRFTLEPGEPVDADLKAWLKLAFKTVASGTR